MKPIFELTPFTLLDYPDHTACIVWFAGCNFRCSYCHNPEMITGKGTMESLEIFDFLKKRIGKLDAVVLSGGEATSYPYLPQFAEQIKEMGFKVKLDTNGSRPKVIEQMINEEVLDYVALDFKAPDCKFENICGYKRQYIFQKSLKYLCSINHIPVEIRTTVHTDLLNENDIKEMMNTLSKHKYNGTYYIQNYRDTETFAKLAPQTKPLDIKNLPLSDDFKIEFRNF